MSNIKNKVTQIIIGSLSLVMIVMSMLCLGSIIPTSVADWVWGVLAVCFGLSLIEVIVYFVFKGDIRFIISKWLLLFFAILTFIIATIGLITGATEMFSVFGALSGWLNFVFILVAYIVVIIQILEMVWIGQEEKEVRLAKRNETVEEKAENK